MPESVDRRTLLEISGAVTAVLAGCTGGEESTETESPTDSPSPTGTSGGDENTTDGGKSPTAAGVLPAGTEIELGARVDGWVGRAPTSIEGTTNPPLMLEAGADYTVTWENLDGEEHELYVENDGGSVVAESDSSEESGETVTVTFTASEALASYYCEYHPESMRGNVTTSGGDGTGTDTGGGTGTDTGGETESSGGDGDY